MTNLRIISKKKRFFLPAVDFFGKYLFRAIDYFCSSRRYDSPESGIRKILIVRLDSIGDVVLSTAILKSLKAKFPESSVTYLLSSLAKDIIEGNPCVDEIITFEAPWHFSKGLLRDAKNYFCVLKLLRRKKFDLVLELEGNAKNIFLIAYLAGIPIRVGRDWTGGGYMLTKVVPWDKKKHMIEYQADIARAVGVDINHCEMFIPLGTEDWSFINSLLRENGINDTDFMVVLSPGARRITKLWPVDRFAIIGDWLAREYGAKIVITGAPSEVDISRRVRELMTEDALVLAGKIKTLKHLAAVIKKAAMVIGNDSGPMHIAAAMKTPSVSLFSSGLPSEYGPYGEIHTVLQRGDLDCRPCTEKKCYRPEGYCMELITVDDVKIAVRDRLESMAR